MALKTIEYAVTVDKISPNTVQFGGTQGDHNVCELVFELDTKLYDSVMTSGKKVVYRFDGYDGQGNVVRGDTIELDSDTVSFAVQEWLTRYGGRVSVYLIISAIENDITEMELYSFPALLELKNRPDAVDKDDENYESLSTLAEVAKESAQIATERAKEIKNLNWSQEFDIDENGDLILTKYDGTEENVGHVKGDTGNSGVYVGAGDMPEDCNVQIDVTGDTIAMDEVATKEYVDHEIATFDFIKVVDALPKSGLPNRIYLVPNIDSAENNLFDEYIWVNNSWEFITTKIVEVELVNYVKREELENVVADVKAISTDYIIEQGTSGIWTYEKWKSGKAVCWCKSVATYVSAHILRMYAAYPFIFISITSALCTLNDPDGNHVDGLHKNAKLSHSAETCTVFVHNPSGDYTSSSKSTVSVEIKGMWKEV